ncbi:DUF3570 domain-containing protein [Massilia antarctica]|uniref:DUF3570 domain-containing protein n=1 Tax=Massilia antarctica TaxID=2765360 RepID=A0AA49A7R6_9BURK|nr:MULTISPECIES: DUF3570 domain-containing protein [Massilia]MCY0914400.1 DUF3570 domain-containing protein [Massilia sp. H27-R4]QPI48860.1 DUF3570 domain-containing protein [Massilia antarctica]CUI03221.1 hypothetical protein BN2497_1219 [Janthinobacterium sp. CG23_2]CUU27007.1 hypothetical protein BN3177_1219 [Janthinobacterium sp. CG23_2]
MTTPLLPAQPAALGHAILAAALMLPGLVHAETAPEHASISVKLLSYEESQSSMDRIRVRAPSISVVAPVAGVWSVTGSLTADDVSGASPRYHTAVSGASRMSDDRKAGDAAVTRYFPRGSLTVGAAYSTEHDYDSRALSVTGAMSSEDKNTTWSLGMGGSDDTINPMNLIVRDESRQTVNFLAGVTQVLGPNDLAQLTLTHNRGHGYFSDPYKAFDNRPRQRNQSALMGRWNHHYAATGGTSRLSYRYYTDSYGIRAHTFGGEYVQPAGQGWIITPSARLYSQRAARFYFDPVYDGVLGEPFRPGYASNPDGYSSADQRLSGFGAVTLGIKVAKQLSRDWIVDVKLEAYQQRGSWRLFDKGSPGLESLRAHSIQLGLTRQW